MQKHMIDEWVVVWQNRVLWVPAVDRAKLVPLYETIHVMLSYNVTSKF